jgi:predicted negative regulator of RcsB-dependent stress response
MRILNSKFFLLAISTIFAINSPAFAQENPDSEVEENEQPKDNSKLVITGNVYVDGLRLEDVTISVFEDDKVIDEVVTDDNGKFKVELALDKMLYIEFKKENYIGKKVEVDSRNVPADNRKYDFYNKGWKVDIYPAELEVNFDVLQKPVAKVVYNPSDDGFSIDKKYERTVRPGLERLSKNVYDAYEKSDMDSEEAFDDYMLAVKDGDMFLKEGDYENALMQYEAAKEILPRESYPDKQIKKTMAIMQDNASVDELYASHITKADNAFDNKQWAEARTSYEQASDVMPKKDYPKDQIDAVIKNIAADKLLASQMKDKEKQDLYDKHIGTADSLLGKSLYAESKIAYNNAITVLPKKEYPKTKLKEINGILASNAKSQKEYESLLANANKLLVNKEYDKAKTEFTNALAVKPDEVIPKTKIKEIDVLLASAAALKAEELALKNQNLADKKAAYDALIISADALLVDKSYTKAKAEYQGATDLFANEEYPKTQIALINKTLLEIEGVDKQYEKLMANGLKNANGNKFELAKSDYLAASNLKPTEQAPKDGIASMDAKMLALLADAEAKQKAIDAKYAGFVADGDALMATEKLTEAEVAYKNALGVKVDEEYPKNQIALINKKLLAIEGVDKQYEKLMTSGLKNANGNKFELAKADYLAASNLKPTEQAPKDGIASMDAKMLAIVAAADAKQKAIDDKYAGFVADGDALLALDKLSEAKEAYTNALGVKANEEYPKTQIADITGKLAAIAAADATSAKEAKELALKTEQYNAAIGKADQLYKAGNLAAAKTGYEGALVIFEGKTYPTSQITEINTKLELAAADAAAEAKLKEELLAKEGEYQSHIKKADAAFATNDFVNARLGYQNAQNVFPDKPYPANQIEKITGLELAKKEAEEQALLLAAQKEENQKKFNEIVAEGDQFVAKGDLQKARYKYEAALKIMVGDAAVTKKMREVTSKIEEERKLAEYHAKNDTEFNRQLAKDYPNGLNETKKQSGKTINRIVVVSGARGDEYKKEVYSYGAVFFFKNGKKIDESTFKRETKGH